jgi:hypothetical protein
MKTSGTLSATRTRQILCAYKRVNRGKGRDGERLPQNSMGGGGADAATESWLGFKPARRRGRGRGTMERARIVF